LCARLLLFNAVSDPAPQAIATTSPSYAEDKANVCANLGVVLAQADKDTLLVDFDFRKPELHAHFGLANTTGVADVLAGERSIQDTCQSALPGLKVVATGAGSVVPPEFLDCRRLSSLFASARRDFEYVLVNSAPIGLVWDSAVLATQTDGLLLVLDGQKTLAEAVLRARRNLEKTHTGVLGTIMDNVEPRTTRDTIRRSARRSRK
jgi:receptor protein-tyrosine kinase